MKVLVTGAHGFLGRHVAQHFERGGNTVTGIGHGAWEASESAQYGISLWHQSDLDLDALVAFANDPDVIVHCAGSGSVAFSMSKPFEDYQRTVSSTATVLEYIRLHSPKTALIYPSSAAVYGVATQLPISETAPLAPSSPYGVHKLVSEQLCRSYAQSFGLSVGIIRFFSIYGEGLRKQLLWDACCKIVQGDYAFFGTGEELRDWLNVDDAARLIAAIVPHCSVHPVINGGSGSGLSVCEVLTEVFKAFEVDERPIFNGKLRSGDPPGYQADIGRSVALDWQTRVEFKEGIRRYVTWFKSLQ